MQEYQQIESCFEQMGARAGIGAFRRNTPQHLPLAIDVIKDERGERFDIQLAFNVRLDVLDVQPQHRHLLLSASNSVGEDRFLCGHDEFHWFVAALSHERETKTVEAAKEALKPELVKRVERRKRRGKHRRKSDVFMRQGEWFFLPWPHAGIDRGRVVRNGLLIREAGSKPHCCEFLYEDGEREYQCDRYPHLAFFESEYREILRIRRKAKRWNWRPLPFQPDIYVRGWITHPDHSPLYLDIWHRVQLNKESRKLSMSRLVYRD